MITESKKRNIVHNFIIGTFVMLYFSVSLISTIHVVDFFELSNPTWLAISLAIAFEIGAAASLAALIILDKTSKSLVWFLFIILSSFQMMGNSFYAYMNLVDFQGWIDLFALNDYELIEQKRILAVISGAVLPLVALGFIKSLVDYIRPGVEVLANEYDGEEYVKEKIDEVFIVGDSKPKDKKISKNYIIPIDNDKENNTTIKDFIAPYNEDIPIKPDAEVFANKLTKEDEEWLDLDIDKIDDDVESTEPTLEDDVIQDESTEPTLEGIEDLINEHPTEEKYMADKKYMVENGKPFEIPTTSKLNAVNKNIDNSKVIDKDDSLKRS